MPSCLTPAATEPCCCLFSIVSPSKSHNLQPCFLPLSKTHFPKSSSLRAKASSSSTKECSLSMADLEKQSFYELLGISESGNLVDIKQAYREMARKYHPDVSPPDRVEEYTQRFIRVQEAYETLSDPRRRALYDRDVANGLHLAFSARKAWDSDEGLGGKSEWKNRWQSQVSELKRRSMDRDATENMSWGARMRRQREASQGGI